jgi:predicted transcriptional regulator
MKIGELAAELGVSKQAISQKIYKLGLDKELTKQGRWYILTNEQVNAVKSSFVKATDKRQATKRLTDNHISLSIVEKITSQLEAKDRQIEELNARLAETTAALVSAQKTAEAAQALHAGTLKKMLTDGEEKSRRRWPWSRKLENSEE